MSIAQDIKKIESQLDTLFLIKDDLESSLNSIKKKIYLLNKKKLELQVDSYTIKGIKVALSSNGKIRKEPNPISSILMTPKKGTKVIVVGYTNDYYKIIFGKKIAYLSELYLPQNNDLSRLKTLTTKVIKSSETYLRKKSLSKLYEGSKRIIYTGPKGGRYYINSKGKKVYIK